MDDTIVENSDSNVSKKSENKYRKSWEEFRAYIKHDKEPVEEEYLAYFDMLRTTKNFKASSIWSKFSQLNGKHRQLYNAKLQDFKKLSALLNSYNEGYEPTSCNIFTAEQLRLFLEMPLYTPYWVARKCITVLMISGGLRIDELKSINICDLQEIQGTYHINFKREVQGEIRDQVVVLPEEFYPFVKHYLVMLKQYLGDDVDGSLLKSTFHDKDGFHNQNMGRNNISLVGRQIAEKLNLPDPNKYTPRSFRVTSAVLAAQAGYTTPELMERFGWAHSKTADRLKKSAGIGEFDETDLKEMASLAFVGSVR